MMRDVLLMLRTQGYAPRTMLDIGAHIGTFTQEFLGVFSGCVPTLIEPNPFCLADLGKLGFEQHGVAASNEPGVAEMFLSREWLQSTGASLYRENTAVLPRRSRGETPGRKGPAGRSVRRPAIRLRENRHPGLGAGCHTGRPRVARPGRLYSGRGLAGRIQYRRRARRGACSPGWRSWASTAPK